MKRGRALAGLSFCHSCAGARSLSSSSYLLPRVDLISSTAIPVRRASTGLSTESCDAAALVRGCNSVQKGSLLQSSRIRQLFAMRSRPIDAALNRSTKSPRGKQFSTAPASETKSSSASTQHSLPESFSAIPPKTPAPAPSSQAKEFWRRWTAERPLPDRWTFAWWWEMAIIFTVFGITGSSSVFFVRPVMGKVLGLEGNFGKRMRVKLLIHCLGSMKEGPWSFRLISLVVLMPIYSVLLVCVGTVFGRHAYFKKFALRMWKRFIPSRFLK